MPPDQDVDPPFESEFDELVVRCLARLENEGEAALEAECAQHPELAERLRRRVHLLRDAGLIELRGGAARDFPEQLGDFHLLRRLGAGGMGVVYLAEQASLGRRIALKLIRPEHLYFPGARSRFLREAQATARLAHPGIVPVHTVGEESGIPYLAMEWVEGAPLGAVLAQLAGRDPARLTGADLLTALCERARVEPQTADRARMPFASSWFDACAWIAREFAQALEHAHQRGVVHRDVKPSNVMLTASGRVMLVDFGLASTAGAGEATRTSSQLGSLPYMAPELIDGRGEANDARVDVYGLGVTLYEMLALRRAFADEDASRLRASIVEARVPRLAALVPSVPRDLQGVVEVAMSPERGARYRSAADVARDLSHVLAREPIEARPAGALTRLRRWAERHPARALAAGLAVSIAVGGPLGYGWVQSRAAARERELGAQLEHTNQSLIASNAELERKRGDLSSSLARESDERQRAQGNFDQALDAVDTMLTRVGDQTLAHVPQTEAVRRRLLQDALAFYERFAAQKGDDPSVRLRRAITQRKVASIQLELGNLEDARESGAAAVQALRELEAATFDDPELRPALDTAMAEYASTLSKLGRRDEAEELQRELIARLEQRRDGSVTARKLLASTEENLATLLNETERGDEALAHARAAIDVMAPLVAEAPEDLDLRHRYGVALLACARQEIASSPVAATEAHLLTAIGELRAALAQLAGHPPIRESLATGLGLLGLLLSGPEIEVGYEPRGPNAEAALREAIAINTQLAAEYPLNPLYRENLAGEAGNLCVHLVRLGRTDEARAFGERVVHVYEELIALQPAVADHKSRLAVTLANLGALCLAEGRAADALPALDAALERFEQSLAAEPDSALFAERFRLYHVPRVEALVALARWRDALEELQRFEARSYDDDSCLWGVERRLDCARLARLDESLPQAERDTRSQTLRDEAVERLRTLVSTGFDRRRLAALEQFASLRDHAGFRALVDAAAER